MMNKTNRVALLVLASWTSVIASAQTYTATTGAPGHLQKAESLAIGLSDQLKANITGDGTTTYNLYGATWSNVVIQFGSHSKDAQNNLVVNTPYKAYAVCGSFVTKMLSQAYSWNWSTVTMQTYDKAAKAWVSKTTTSPNASEYYRAIETENKFTARASVADVVAGDICAIRYTPGYDANDSGHVMIVRQMFNKRSVSVTENGQSVEKYHLWDMELVDCSSQAHTNDTRTSSNGVGIGQMTVVCDVNDKVLGYSMQLQTFTTEAGIKAVLDPNSQWQTYRPMIFGAFKSNPL